MRSASLFAVAVLAVVLAASSFNSVAATTGGADVLKVTTNGDTTTKFHFVATQGTLIQEKDLTGGPPTNIWELVLGAGATAVIQEIVPSGWVLKSIQCDSGIWTPDLANHLVTVQIQAGVVIICTFTNDPAPPVGGFIEPVNTFAVLVPWLAAIGLVGCIGVAVVVAKKRRP